MRCFKKYSEGRLKLWKKISAFVGASPGRTSAIHYVNPPAFINVALKVVKVLIGPKVRNRIYVHSGSTDEILKRLSRFGLGSREMLPAIYGGDLSFTPPAKLTLKC